MAKSLVSAAAVRTWGRENIDAIRAHAEKTNGEAMTDEQFAPLVKCLGETARGRLNPVVVEAFTARNRGKDYAEKAVPNKPDTMVEQPYWAIADSGRKVTRKWKGTATEARALYGATSEKGRVNHAALREVLEADFLAATAAPAEA